MGRRDCGATASCSMPSDRQRRRIVLKGEKGTEFLLDFAKPVTLHDGDGLVLDDGAIVLVAGAPEALVEISAHSALDTARLAWHLGNRHTDVQIVGDKIAHPPRSCAGGHAARPRRASCAARGAVRSGAGRCAAWAWARTMIHAHVSDRAPALYRLMAWLSPAFPVGAFSYSSGIEWAVEAGDIKDADTLQGLARGHAGRRRRLLRRRVFRPRPSRALPTTRRCMRWPNSPPPSRRRRSAIWKPPRRAMPLSRPRARPGQRSALDRLKAVWDWAGRLSGRGGGRRRRPRHCARAGACRLSASRRRQLGLRRRAADPARPDRRPARARRARSRSSPRPPQRALTTALDDIGSSAFRADLASARHETQYTRLFRS